MSGDESTMDFSMQKWFAIAFFQYVIYVYI